MEGQVSSGREGEGKRHRPAFKGPFLLDATTRNAFERLKADGRLAGTTISGLKDYARTFAQGPPPLSDRHQNLFTSPSAGWVFSERVLQWTPHLRASPAR